jgi:hypothetical protein
LPQSATGVIPWLVGPAATGPVARQCIMAGAHGRACLPHDKLKRKRTGQSPTQRSYPSH